MHLGFLLPALATPAAIDVSDLRDHWVSAMITVFSLIVVGLLIRWVLHRLIERLVARAAHGLDSTVAPRRAQRATTMGDLLKSIVTGVMVAVFGTMVLSAVGVNIAPIIASAGVIGLALGFGAQSLVKDYLSGIFMIFEDQFGVGDVIDVGEATGKVEAVSLRVTRLRAIDGTVWWVPNGEILRVGNKSQNWSRAVVDISVGYGEDLARVQRVLGEVAGDLWRDDEFAGQIIEEPEITGVEDLAADAVTLRVLVKTAPLQQWPVARELRQRIKGRFDHEGIEIPFAQRVVWHRDESERAGQDGGRGDGHPTGGGRQHAQSDAR